MTGCKDISHLLSDEAKIRKPSPIKTTMKYFSDPDIIFLGAGMPPGDMFPFQSVSFESVSLDDDTSSSSTVKGCIGTNKDDLELQDDIPLGRALQYGNSRGQPELVSFLKEHSTIFHNIRYDDWDLITTAGSTQAWDACLRLFCNKGDTVLLEEYTYSSSVEAATTQGLNCVAMKTDNHGIVPEELEKLLQNWNSHSQGPFPKLLYTIPNGQNPTGSTLKDERKPAIIKLASKFDLLIIEDDPYYFLQMNEFGQPQSTIPDDLSSDPKEAKTQLLGQLSKSLLEWDYEGRVIRMDSVSKTFAPGCRLGWVIGPKYLLDSLWNYHEVSMQSTCGFAQTVINGMLQRWGQIGYMKWLLKLRNSYSIKRDHSLNQCFKYLPKDICSVNLPTSGMFFMVFIDAKKHPQFESKFQSNTDLMEQYLYEKFVNRGLLLACSSWFRVDPQKMDTLAFRGSYASVSAGKMEKGIRTLGDIIREEFQV